VLPPLLDVPLGRPHDAAGEPASDAGGEPASDPGGAPPSDAMRATTSEPERHTPEPPREGGRRSHRTPGEREVPGTELFDATLRLLGSAAERRGDEEPDDADGPMKDAIKRRLAWGDEERAILSDASAVSERLLAAARPCLVGPHEDIELSIAVTEAGASVGRVMTLALARRVARQRAAHVREERAEQRLIEALERQRSEIAELTDLLRRRGS
jgi:hypothetical protein